MEHQSTEFVFPEEILDLEGALTIQEILRQLELKRVLGGIEREIVRWRVSSHKSIYAYVVCRTKGCRAALRYRKEGEGSYRLYAALTKHKHRLASSKILRFQVARQYIAATPKEVPLASLKIAVCRHFQLTEKQFYYIASRLRQQQLNFNTMTAELERQGYEVFVSGEERAANEPPHIAVLVSPDMKRAFSRYGDRVSFDLTFRLIKNRTSQGGTWKVGVFLGTSSTGRIAPLGVVLTLAMTTEAYKDIFRMFFQAHGGRPQVIVSDQERAVHAALKELAQNGEYDGLHCLDGYHLLHNIYKKLRDKSSIRHFNNLLRAKNNEEFLDCVARAERYLHQTQLPLLRQFLANKDSHCFSQVGSSEFLGFSLSSSPNECFHSVLKRLQPSQKNYTLALSNILHCSSRLLRSCEDFQEECYPYEKVYRLPELKALRLCLAKPIFWQLLDELSSALLLEIVERGDSTLLVRQLTRHFSVTLEDGLWCCGCGYIQKSCLPCRHLLKVLIFKRGSILNHIPERWKAHHFAEVSNSKQIIPRGREPSSKRKIYH